MCSTIIYKAMLTAITCDGGSDVPNGTVEYRLSKESLPFMTNGQVPYGTVARYSCECGFTPFGGNQIQRCEENGLWNGTKPNCTGESAKQCHL